MPGPLLAIRTEPECLDEADHSRPRSARHRRCDLADEASSSAPRAEADLIGKISLGTLAAAGAALSATVAARIVQRRRSLALIVASYAVGLVGATSGVFAMLGESAAFDVLGATCLATSLAAAALASWNVTLSRRREGGATVALTLRF